MRIEPNERASKKAKTVPAAGKVMATIFWDSLSIILLAHLYKGKTITGEYYASLLDRFDIILTRVVRQYSLNFLHETCSTERSI